MADHLSIGEVLALLQDDFPDVTISKIRFLESQGLLDPERTPSGYRKFYEADIERLRWILKQQRENFLPLKVIKVRLLGEAGAGAPPSADEGQEALATAARQPGPPAGAAPSPTDDPDAPVPIWMSDLARQAQRTTQEGEDDGPASDQAAKGQRSTSSAAAHGEPAAVSNGPAARAWPGAGGSANPLDAGPVTVSLTAVELARAAHIDITLVRELERFGLLNGRQMGSDRFYDGEALMVAEMSAAFLARGLEPRHLRMFKVAAEREAGVLEQVVMPLLKQRNPQARQQALDLLAELALLGQQLRNTLLRASLQDHLQPR